MSQHTEECRKGFKAAGALSKYRRVKLSAAGTVDTAAALDPAIGYIEQAAFTAGEHVNVRLETCEGTKIGVANGALSVGDYVYGAASGKVGATGFFLEGRALEAAAADGDEIEILPLENGPKCVATVAAAGSTAADAAALTANINNVTGADGTKGVIAVAVPVGDKLEVYNAVATNGLKIYPPSGGTINGGSADAAITMEGKTHAILRRLSSTAWACVFTVNT